MARNNYLHQPTLPLSFLFGWHLSAPLTRQHGQKQIPAPTHTATLLSLWLGPFCTPPQPTWQKKLPAPTHTATPLSLWLVPFCTPLQPTWSETTTCTNPHCHSPFSLVGTFLHPSSANMVRNNYLHQPTLPFSFLFGWYLSAPLLSQHGQKQLPAPTHTATLLSLWLWYLSAGLRVGGWGAARFLEERILDRLSLEPAVKRQTRYHFIKIKT